MNPPAAQDDPTEVADLCRMMSGPHGRRFVHRLIARAGVFRLSYDELRPEETHATAFREGCRSEGNRLLVLLMRHCPGQWATALEEARAAASAVNA